MAAALRPEDLHRRLDLGERADEVGHRGLAVGVEPAGAERGTLPDAGVHDDPVDPPVRRGEVPDHREDGVVVGDVERLHRDPYSRVRGGDLVAEAVEAIRAPRAQREVVAEGGELAGHLGAEPAARAGDEDGGHEDS